jgi:hypothetical protein
MVAGSSRPQAAWDDRQGRGGISRWALRVGFVNASATVTQERETGHHLYIICTSSTLNVSVQCNALTIHVSLICPANVIDQLSSSSSTCSSDAPRRPPNLAMPRPSLPLAPAPPRAPTAPSGGLVPCAELVGVRQAACPGAGGLASSWGGDALLRPFPFNPPIFRDGGIAALPRGGGNGTPAWPATGKSAFWRCCCATVVSMTARVVAAAGGGSILPGLNGFLLPIAAIVRPPMACCGLMPRRAAISGAITGGRAGRPSAPAGAFGGGGTGSVGLASVLRSRDPELEELEGTRSLVAPPFFAAAASPLELEGAGERSPGFHARERSGVPLPCAAIAAALRACCRMSSILIPVLSSHSPAEPDDEAVAGLCLIENSMSSPPTSDPREPGFRRGAWPRGPWLASGGVGTLLPPGEPGTWRAVRRLR